MNTVLPLFLKCKQFKLEPTDPSRYKQSETYVLELNNNKFYIGKTEIGITRINQHCNKIKSNKWIFDNKILKYNMYKMKSKYDEEILTLMYMKEYGPEHVKGGIFCEPNIDRCDSKILFINRIINDPLFDQPFSKIRNDFETLLVTIFNESMPLKNVDYETSKQYTKLQRLQVLYTTYIEKIYLSATNRCLKCGSSIIHFGKTPCK